MGRLARPASGGLTKYYWYPGEGSDWRRAGLAAAAGLLTLVVVSALTHSPLAAAVLGGSVTAGVAGLTFGRKDARALHAFCGFAAGDAVRAGWRALVKGFGAAAAAVLVVHSAPRGGFVATWLLPVVPAIVGALAHQGGMLWERATIARAERPQPAVPAAPGPELLADPHVTDAPISPVVGPARSERPVADAPGEGGDDEPAVPVA
jgi:hypothetical protein